jgi:hypothetical protein
MQSNILPVSYFCNILILKQSKLLTLTVILSLFSKSNISLFISI